MFEVFVNCEGLLHIASIIQGIKGEKNPSFKKQSVLLKGSKICLHELLQVE